MSDGGHGVVVYARARGALRSLRPVVRVVLEDVALDAVWRDGRLVASTSARLVAEHVGVDAGTAASALRVLRERGFVELEQQRTGRGGRFGLAGYVVRLPAGIELKMASCGDRPHTAAPRPVEPTAAANNATVTSRRRRTTSKRVEQGTFDLGLGAQ